MTNLILFIFAFIGLANTEKPSVEVVSNQNKNASTPRFTTDANNNPVLSWVETDDGKSTLFFAVSKDGGQTFNDKIQVKAPTDFSTHAEGMPRIAFKANGEIWATFEMKAPTKEAPRAANLLFVASKDGGKTWSEATPVHKDMTPGKGHSFSDMIRLPNGELGFTWLDEKMGNYDGRSVKFVQTLPAGGFSNEIVIDSNACQCCRVVLFLDNSKNIHVTYRDLEKDNIRDMSHIVSKDGGKTFTIPSTVFNDGWKVAACPHTGPSMAELNNDFFVAWFSGKSATNEAGIRVAKIGDEKLITSQLNIRAKHPQIVSDKKQLYLLWDESIPAGEQYLQSVALRKINEPEKTIYLSSNSESATYPVAFATSKGLIVAYEAQKSDGKQQIKVQLVKD